MPVVQKQLDAALQNIGVETETETETITGSFALCIKLRYLNIPATYNDKKRLITYPTSEAKRVRRQVKHWPAAGAYPGEVRDMARQLCGLPL